MTTKTLVTMTYYVTAITTTTYKALMTTTGTNDILRGDNACKSRNRENVNTRGWYDKRDSHAFQWQSMMTRDDNWTATMIRTNRDPDVTMVWTLKLYPSWEILWLRVLIPLENHSYWGFLQFSQSNNFVLFSWVIFFIPPLKVQSSKMIAEDPLGRSMFCFMSNFQTYPIRDY